VRSRCSLGVVTVWPSGYFSRGTVVTCACS